MTRGWISNLGLGALVLSLCAGACGEDSTEATPDHGGNEGGDGSGGDGSVGGGEEPGTAGRYQGDLGGAGGALEPPSGAGGGEDAAAGDGGASGHAGGTPSTSAAGAGGAGTEAPCDENTLRDSLPDVFVAALDPTPCIAGAEELNGLVTWCENAPCACKGSVLWTASLVGSTLTAVGNAAAALTRKTDVSECTANFTGQIIYTAEIAFSEEGGALHTTNAGGTFSYENAAIADCPAGANRADEAAERIVATYEAMDDAAVIASNACP